MDTDDDFELITTLTPVDVTAVRDDGIKALVMLAVSLGWNAHHKHNQPMIITSRYGRQKRLPTNTSIRMSVFQAALSTIMAYTEPEKVPTVELVDQIIAATKPSIDHQRRLRLAVGETPTQHRERVVAAETEMKGAREPQPLTTRIEMPEHMVIMGDELFEVVEEPATQVATEEQEMELPIQGAFTPADGGTHGQVFSREPFQATRNTSGRITTTYTSDISFERRWTDGYIDYECQICGKAYATPKGVGSHSQHHDQHDQPAWKRASAITRTARVPDLEWEEPPSEEGEQLPVVEPEWAVSGPPTDEPVFTNVDDSFILGQIAALVAPDLVAKVVRLEAENAQLRERLDELEGEFDAFLELAASRRKKPDGG